MRQRGIPLADPVPGRKSRTPPAGMLCSWPPDLGPAGVDHVVARPAVYRRPFPRQVGRWLGLRATRPAAARLAPPLTRLAEVTVHAGSVHLVDAKRRSSRVARSGSTTGPLPAWF